MNTLFQIFVKSLDGRTLAIDVSPHDTIGSLKDKIHQKNGPLPVEQRLVSSGKNMTNDELTVEFYGLQKESTVWVLARMVAGSFSDLPDEELRRLQHDIRIRAHQDSDPEQFENMANQIGKILIHRSLAAELEAMPSTYDSSGLVRSLNYEGKHLTQAMKRFEDAPIGFRVLLASSEKFYLLIKEGRKEWLRVDENADDYQGCNAEFRLEDVVFISTPQNTYTPQNTLHTPQIASTWAISVNE